MNDKKHILIGKIGKSVKLKNTVVSTGDDAPMIFYQAIAKMNPNYEFYFVGPNDLKKMSDAEYEKLFPNKNVHSVHCVDESRPHWYECLVENIEAQGIKPDFALLMNGLPGSTNVPNFLPRIDGKGIAQQLESFKRYCGPYVYALNYFKCPYYLISEDARYITFNSRDILQQPRLIFSQINGEYESMKHIFDINKLTEYKSDKVKAIYSGTEKIFMMGLEENWADSIDIERKLNSTGNKFIVLSNGCGTGAINHPGNNSSRLPTYKKWIIDNFKGTPYENTMIYGSWDKKIHAEYPEKIVNKKIYELMDEIADAKYTICYSQAPGFVTIKPWEMICLGLIPFIHPDYDKYRLLNFPEFLYVNTPQELLQKVNELEENPEKYRALMNGLIKKFKPSWLNGKALNNFIFGKIAEDLGFIYEPSQGMTDRLIFHRFDKQVIKL